MVLPAKGLLGILGGFDPDDAAEVVLDDDPDVVTVLDAEVLEPQAASRVALARAAPRARRTRILFPPVLMVPSGREP